MQEDGRGWGLAGEGLGLNPAVLDASEALRAVCVCVGGSRVHACVSVCLCVRAGWPLVADLVSVDCAVCGAHSLGHWSRELRNCIQA